MGIALLRRQNNNFAGDTNDNGDYLGYSDTTVAIKWAFVGAILLLFILWFVGGYYHAQRRIKKGMPPLRYHRFLLPHRQRMQYMPRPDYGYYPQQNRYGEGYPMQNYAPPPPAYHSEHIPPPVYQPPEGGSKVNPAQDWATPPPGPPPGHIGAGEPSSGMQSVPLNQESNDQEQFVGGPPVQKKKKKKKAGMMSRLNPFK